MKPDELQQMTVEELKNKLSELTEERFRFAPRRGDDSRPTVETLT